MLLNKTAFYGYTFNRLKSWNNELYTIIVRFSIMIIGFFTSVYTSRVLGPEGRGEYFYFITLSMLLTQFSQMGLVSSNTFYISKKPHWYSMILNNTLLLSISLGVMSVVGLFFFSYLFSKQFNSYLIWLFLLVPGSLFFLLATNILIGMNQVKTYNSIQILSNALVLFIILFLGCFNLKAQSLIAMMSLYWFFVSLSLWIYLNKTRQGQFSFNWQYFQVSLNYGLKAYFITFMGLLILRGNVFFLKYFCDDTELGYFSIAIQLYDCLLILPASLGLILFPQLVKEAHQSQRKLILYQSLKQSFLLMCVFCLISMVFIDIFVELFFGKDFLPSVNIFYYLLPSAILLSLITIMSQFFASIGNPIQLMMIWLLASLVAIIGGYWLIPLYQGEGAAISMCLSYLILFLFMLFMIQKNFKRS